MRTKFSPLALEERKDKVIVSSLSHTHSLENSLLFPLAERIKRNRLGRAQQRTQLFRVSLSSLEEEVRGQGYLLLTLQEEVDKSLFSLYKKAEGETLYPVETRTKLSPPLEKKETKCKITVSSL